MVDKNKEDKGLRDHVKGIDVINELRLLALSDPVAHCVIGLVQQGCPLEVALFTGFKCLVEQLEDLQKQIIDQAMNQARPLYVPPNIHR